MAEDRLTLLLGLADADHLRIRPSHRMYPEARDVWDGNWIATRIEVQAGGFHGSVDASLRSEELLGFRDDLRRIVAARQGEASLESMEEWLTVRVVGDGRGHWEAVCEMRDAPGSGNRLYFTLGFDTDATMNGLIETLDRVTQAFPVLH